MAPKLVRVRMIVSMAGMTFTLNAGRLALLEEDEAGRIVAAGFATRDLGQLTDEEAAEVAARPLADELPAAPPAGEPEAAVLEAPEAAQEPEARPEGRRKRRG